MKYLSICIPTNGITEWVIKVVDSIYSQKVDDNLFEVIITDNGESEQCKEAVEKEFGYHNNLIYKRTKAQLFLNQIESFKLADGTFVKFQNHRAIMNPGSIEYLIGIVQKYASEKPTIFFCDGIDNDVEWNEKPSFDEFVRTLGYWISYSGGLSFWKEDFAKNLEKLDYNYLFPHTTIVLNKVEKAKYIICTRKISEEIPTGHGKKGKYKIYYAFGVELPSIILNLYKEGSITYGTYKSVLRDIEKCIINHYIMFSIKGDPHSYDLANADEYLNVFFDYYRIKRVAYMKYAAKKILGRE